ncbi:PREDICTED: uncharacterized protein LOC106848903 [Sturnus vulgaris]|uniref:uncharacterized protein LOC106848903 n=1 Tax=Sturnus vulgaris TaxID=9172 RepID=UPI00071A620F|nr:PREDICTED: uncharacterized protein LOC106848903 [Sturnus vulgaris]
MRSPRINPCAPGPGLSSPRELKSAGPRYEAGARGPSRVPHPLLRARRGGGEGARRSAGSQCKEGLGRQRIRSALGESQAAPGELMVLYCSSCSSVSLFFFSPHKINAQLLLLPPRELLTLRSQHLCTCQPLRSHSQSGLRSLLLGTDHAFGWRGEEMSFPATKTRARGKEKRQPSRSLSLWATDAASVVNTPCKLLCGSVCGSFFLCKALNTKVPSEQQQRALIRLHYACMEKQTNKKN